MAELLHNNILWFCFAASVCKEKFALEDSIRRGVELLMGIIFLMEVECRVRM